MHLEFKHKSKHVLYFIGKFLSSNAFKPLMINVFQIWPQINCLPVLDDNVCSEYHGYMLVQICYYSFQDRGMSWGMIRQWLGPVWKNLTESEETYVLEAYYEIVYKVFNLWLTIFHLIVIMLNCWRYLLVECSCYVKEKKHMYRFYWSTSVYKNQALV